MNENPETLEMVDDVALTPEMVEELSNNKGEDDE